MESYLFIESSKRIQRMLRLPGYMYKHKTLLEIEGLAGKVVEVYLNTGNRTRGIFARLVVNVNLDRPLTSQILINGKLHKTEYEFLSIACFHCERYKHLKEVCPSRIDG